MPGHRQLLPVRVRPTVAAESGMCLLMYDTEPMKPTNTGWLIADIIKDTYAFGWSRVEIDAHLRALLDDPQWQPYIVFPGEFVAQERVVADVAREDGKRPLFILLDATWNEARKMFRKSPYLEKFPVLSLAPEQISRYRLRRSRRDDHFCTAEVAALCLELAGDVSAAACWMLIWTCSAPIIWGRNFNGRLIRMTWRTLI